MSEPEVSIPRRDRITPGQYPAYARSSRIYRDKVFHRWVCVVIFDVLSAALTKVIATVPLFLNLGTGNEPKAGLRSRFWTTFCDAIGHRPLRHDRITARIFEHRYATVTVQDTVADFRGVQRPQAAYSVVKSVQWNTGGQL